MGISYTKIAIALVVGTIAFAGLFWESIRGIIDINKEDDSET